MNDREIREAFRMLTEGTDPADAADAVRRRIEEQGERTRRRNVVMTRRKWTAALASAAALVLLTAAVAACPASAELISSPRKDTPNATDSAPAPATWRLSA